MILEDRSKWEIMEALRVTQQHLALAENDARDAKRALANAEKLIKALMVDIHSLKRQLDREGE